MVRIISGSLGEFVGPGVDDRMAIDVVDTGHDAVLEFVFRCHPDMAQDRASKFGEEALDQVEPRAVLGRERELEAAWRSGGKPSSGFSGDVSGMIIEDQPDRGAGRIGVIEQLEELDKLSAAVAVSDQGMHLAGEQIDPRQQAERAMAFVFMIAREGRIVRLAWAANPVRSSRWLGFPAFHRRKRSLPACCVSAVWRQLFSALAPRDRHTEPPPSSARTRRRGVPDSSALCAA